MVDIVKRTARTGAKPTIAAKTRTVVKPAKAAAEPIVAPVVTPPAATPPILKAPVLEAAVLKAPAAATPDPQPVAAPLVSPQPDPPPPVEAVPAPTANPVGTSSVSAAPASETPAYQDTAYQTPAYLTPANEKKDATMETIQSITEKTKALFTNGFGGTTAGEFNEQAKGALEKSAKIVEDLTAFGKGNIEAMVESSKIAVKNVETLGQEAADYAKTSFESATEAAKTLAAAKTPTEFVKLQSDYARTAFDSMIAEGSRSTERLLKMFGEFAQPISNRVAVATDKIKTAA